MEKFKATKYNEKGIELTGSNELQKLYDFLQKEEDFILEWEEGDVLRSKVMFGTHIASKVKSGDIELSAKTSTGGE